MATTPFVTTASATPTEFIPLATAWPSAGTGCAASIYQQFDGHFLGWDPWYALNVDGGASTCWPPQQISWWNQTPTPTTTVLGPNFVCPEAYHVIQRDVIDSRTERIFCCPSSYSIFVAAFARPTFPSQCISTLTAGETLSYLELTRMSLTSTTVQSGTVTVFGIPVNGYNIVAPSTSTSTSTSEPASSSSAAAATATPTSTASSTSPAQPNSSDPGGSNGSPVGAAVGASVGAVVGILLLALGAFMLWRRRRKARQMPVEMGDGAGRHAEASEAAESVKPAELQYTPAEARRLQPAEWIGAEIYEMPGNDASATLASYK